MQFAAVHRSAEAQVILKETGQLRGNKLSNTIYENYDDILEKACQAWMFFANDKEQVASITTRQWAKVNL
jgi:hypothetical protein